MGTGQHIGELHDVDIAALLERAEDPRELLDHTSAQQEELLGRIWIAITDVAASRQRAHMREGRLRRSADRLQRQAGQALTAGRDDQARQALAWRASILRHVAELTAEQAALRASEERLSTTARRLQEEMEAFRIHREAVNAAHANAQGLGTGQVHAQLDVISGQAAVEEALAQIGERTAAQ